MSIFPETVDQLELLDWNKVVFPNTLERDSDLTKYEINFVKQVFGPRFQLLTTKLANELNLKRSEKTLFCIWDQCFSDRISKEEDNRRQVIDKLNFSPNIDEGCVMIDDWCPVSFGYGDYGSTGSGCDPIFVYV